MLRNEDPLTGDRLAPARAYRDSPWITLPVIGWFVEYARWSRIARPIGCEIEDVLLARASFPISEWSDDELERRIAATLVRGVGESVGWPADRLRPDDAVEVALWDPDDGLSAVAVFLDLEDAFGLDLPDEEWSALVSGTLGEFVGELARRVRAAA